MNSLDPWRLIVTDAYGDVVVPRARYGHPFYREVPSWPHDDAYGTKRQLFDGVLIGADPATAGVNMPNILGAELTALSAPGYGFGYGYPFRAHPSRVVFFGAEAPPSQVPTASRPVVVPGPLIERRGLTAEVAPILAPATGGVMVKKHLDDKQVLHVEICVDGKCYSTSMNLAPAIAMVMKKLAAWHASQPPPATVVSTVQQAVGAAEDMIVGALVSRHIDTVAAGWLSDLGNVVKSVALGPVAAMIPDKVKRGITSTLRKFKGPIGAAAGVAAAAGATLIPGAGPFVAPVAGKLANDLVQSAAGDDAAKKRVIDAAQQAATDPNVAAALRAAEKAAANSTVAHYVQDTAKKAAQGDSSAQREIVKVADDAQKGDPAAQAVADLIASAMRSEWGAELWEQMTGRGPGVSGVSGWSDDVVGAKPKYRMRMRRPRVSGWSGDVVGAAIDDVREKARAHAVTKPGAAAGVILTVDGRLHGRGFRNLDDAIDWLQHITRNRTSFTYAAAYEKDAEGAAYIQDEEFGSTPREMPGSAMTGWWY